MVERCGAKWRWKIKERKTLHWGKFLKGKSSCFVCLRFSYFENDKTSEHTASVCMCSLVGEEIFPVNCSTTYIAARTKRAKMRNRWRNTKCERDAGAVETNWCYDGKVKSNLSDTDTHTLSHMCSLRAGKGRQRFGVNFPFFACLSMVDAHGARLNGLQRNTK